MTDKLWEAALTACYGDTKPNLTQSERKKIGKLLNELREINATPEDLIARAKQYKKCMPPGCVMTLAAIVNHWSRLAPPKKLEVRASTHQPPVAARPTHEGYKAAIDCLPGFMQRQLKAKHEQ